jgi:hypothetical protein
VSSLLAEQATRTQPTATRDQTRSAEATMNGDARIALRPVAADDSLPAAMAKTGRRLPSCTFAATAELWVRSRSTSPSP